MWGYVSIIIKNYIFKSMNQEPKPTVLSNWWLSIISRTQGRRDAIERFRIDKTFHWWWWSIVCHCVTIQVQRELWLLIVLVIFNEPIRYQDCAISHQWHSPPSTNSTPLSSVQKCAQSLSQSVVLALSEDKSWLIILNVST